MKPHDHSLYFIDKCMPRHIWDILDDYYYNSGRRKGKTWERAQQAKAQYEKYYKNDFRYKKSRIKSGLTSYQKMMVFSFMMSLDSAKYISFEESTLF